MVKLPKWRNRRSTLRIFYAPKLEPVRARGNVRIESRSPPLSIERLASALPEKNRTHPDYVDSGPRLPGYSDTQSPFGAGEPAELQGSVASPRRKFDHNLGSHDQLPFNFGPYDILSEAASWVDERSGSGLLASKRRDRCLSGSTGATDGSCSRSSRAATGSGSFRSSDKDSSLLNYAHPGIRLPGFWYGPADDASRESSQHFNALSGGVR